MARGPLCRVGRRDASLCRMTSRLRWLGATLSCLATLPPLSAQSDRLVGTVVDALAYPMPSVDVQVVADDDAVVARTKTDGTGTFVFGGLPERSAWRVRATTEGCIEAQVIARTEDGAPVELRLYDAATLTGRVVDGEGQPIVGSEVLASSPRPLAFHSPDAPALTDAEGRFRLERVPLGAIEVWAAASGFVSGVQPMHVVADATVDVVLARGVGLTIDIAVTGLPLAEMPGLRIGVHASTSGGSVPLPPRQLAVRLDADGRGRVSGLPTFRYIVSASATGVAFEPSVIELWPQHGGPSVIPRTPTKGVAARTDLVASRIEPVTLRGWLGDEDGHGLAGETVVLRGARSRAQASAVTRSDGAFTIVSPVPIGGQCSFTLRDSAWCIDGPGRSGVVPDPRARASDSAMVDPDRALVLRAERASTIRGRLVDGAGEPVRFARVALEDGRQNRVPRWSPLAMARSGADGSFVFRVHAMPTPLRVCVEGAVGCATSAEFDTAPGSVTDVDLLRLSPSASIRGLVRNPAGEALAGARVRLLRWDDASGTQRSSEVIDVVTDRQGRFRFTGVPIGTASLQAMLAEEAVRRALERFEVKAGAELVRDLVAPSAVR